MMEFLAMGGYAWYVWMSYGAVAIVVATEIVATRARLRRARSQARHMSAAPAAPTARFDPARST
ncbi:MAG TPA: heme exporter protein CcmD [Casimicrobiaceae bacterium]|nr:heme exporter protein CcmD [Casimicrobiaceae bacterium]